MKKFALFFLISVACIAYGPQLSGAQMESPEGNPMAGHGHMGAMHMQGQGCGCGMAGCGMMGKGGCGMMGKGGCGMMGGMGMRDGGMMRGGMGMMHGRMDGMEMEHHRFKKLLWSLDLADTQKADISAIHDRAAKDLIRKRADIQIAKLELRELLEREPLDLAAVDAKLRQLANMKTDMVVSVLKTKEQIKTILTPEQRKRLKDMMEGRHMPCGAPMADDAAIAAPEDDQEEAD